MTSSQMPKFAKYLAISSICASFVACNSGHRHQPLVVKGDKVQSASSNVVNYSDIKPVLEKRCASCHSAGPLNWMDEGTFRAAILKGKSAGTLERDLLGEKPRMPISVDISEAERQKIREYVRGVIGQPSSAVPAAEAAKAVTDSKTASSAISTCVACHGENGVATLPATPNLAGQRSTYLQAQLKGFKSSARTSATMNGIAAALKDEDIKTIADLFATMDTAPLAAKKSTASAELVKGGEALAQTCLACHAGEGWSAQVQIPSLNHQDAEYLVAQMTAFKEGKRASEGDTMKAMVAALTGEQMKAIAAYFESLPPQKEAAALPAKSDAAANKVNSSTAKAEAPAIKADAAATKK